MIHPSISKIPPRCKEVILGRLFITSATCSGDEKISTNINVVVAMSGGVDSSVASHLLQSMADESVKVSGLHMMNWNSLDEDDDRDVELNRSSKRGAGTAQSDEGETTASKRRRSRTFCEASERDYNDTQSVAQHLSIPLHRVSFASEYWTQVFQPFVESLTPNSPSTTTDVNRNGPSNEQILMPNPDYSCNTFIKFGAMKDYAIEKMNADYIATGHYAQLWHRGYDFAKRFRYNQSSFIEWMKESSSLLEDQVLDAISERPEEEWLLSNSDRQLGVNHRPMLLAGADRSKDQTYFLSGVKTDNFKNVVFPLGHLMKKDTPDKSNVAYNTKYRNQQSVRDIALAAQIPTASKKDSMGICFIGKRNFGQFVSQYLAETPAPGPFVDVDTGEIVGYHKGSTHFTIGQGARISGANTKYFVCGKGGDCSVGKDDSNSVFVCNDTHHPSLYTDECSVDFSSFNWIGLGDEIPNDNGFNHAPIPLVRGQPIELLARTRHLQPLVPCSIRWTKRNSSTSLGMLSIKFHKPMRAVTPGQILALYAGAGGLVCLGGGPIHSRGSSFMERGLGISLSMLHPSGNNDLSLLCHQID